MFIFSNSVIFSISQRTRKILCLALQPCTVPQKVHHISSEFYQSLFSCLLILYDQGSDAARLLQSAKGNSFRREFFTTGPSTVTNIPRETTLTLKMRVSGGVAENRRDRTNTIAEKAKLLHFPIRQKRRTASCYRKHVAQNTILPKWASVCKRATS